MGRRRTFASAVLVVVALLVLMVPGAGVVWAEGCTGVVVQNDSSSSIDEAAICTAAQVWVEAGFKVYIFVTDESPPTEDDWYAVRDTFEVPLGIYDPDAGTFSKGAVAIEITTDTSYPWGQDVAFGEYLFGTPLDNDAAVGRLEGRLKNMVAEGNLTRAIVETFGAAYSTAYPPPTATPKLMPAVVQTGPTTEVNVDFVPVIRGIGLLVFALVVLFGGGLLFKRLLIPAGKEWAHQRKLKKQIATLRARAAHLLTTCDGLLKGDAPEETLLYALWGSNGGGRYPERDGEIRQLLLRCQAALAKASEVWLGLVHADSPRGGKVLRDRVRNWEVLYVTVVGTTERILSMTGDEQEALLDPMRVVRRDETDAQLVAQLDEILREQHGAGDLRVELLVLSPDEVDAEGILGYVDQVKRALFELQQARENAPARVAEAQGLREQLGGSVQPPFEVSEGGIFAHPDGLVAQAEAALEQELWLEAEEAARRALEALARIPETAQALVDAFHEIGRVEMPRRDEVPGTEEVCKPLRESFQGACELTQAGQYGEAVYAATAVKADCRRLAEVVASFVEALVCNQRVQDRICEIGARGFRLEPVQTDLEEVTQDVRVVGEVLKAGNYARAEEFVGELIEDGARALQKMEVLAALHDQNEQKLDQLAREVARVEGYRTAVAEPAWELLRDYPGSNWAGVASNFAAATDTLRRLFDDPANEQDLTSEVARANSMREQDFARAEQVLVEGFADLTRVERELKGVVQQLEQVQGLEVSLPPALPVVGADICRARERRDRDDEKIDASVDAMIAGSEVKLTDAGAAVERREFTLADELLSEAKRLANGAYASAAEQAAEIDSLMSDLVSARARAAAVVGRAQADFAHLVSAAQKASTEGAANSAGAGLKRAQQAESAVAGKEDRALSEALREVIGFYAREERSGRVALEMIAADKREYEGWISSVISAISSARSVISDAARYTRDSDAGSAGSSALRRARSSLPSLPGHGESLDSLRRKKSQAEDAERSARGARSQAQTRIREEEAAREAERRRRAAEARRRREADEAAQRQRAADRRRQEAATARRRRSRSGSSSRSRGSSSGSSSRSRSGSMGSSSRR